MRIPDHIDGCKSCEQFEGRKNTEIDAVSRGSVNIEGENIEWVLIESGKKAAEEHLIFTTTSHHVSEKEVGKRAELNREATRVADSMLGYNYRIVVNTGPRASTRTHYHLHMIKPGESDRLSRAVVNVQETIEALEAPEALKEELRGALLQKK